VKWEHLDDTGQPCTRHPMSEDAIAHYAAVGSRVSGFNHDIASKIQGVMMAIDEISELAALPDLQRAAETAHTALGELNQLLQANRALTKTPVRTAIEIGELVKRAAARVGVTLKSELTGATVHVGVPIVSQALALAIDAAAGLDRRRTIAIDTRIDGNRVEIAMPFAATTSPDAGTSLAIANRILVQQDGELRCSPERLVIWLPLFTS
jgi:hypothetical protein